MLAGEVRFCQEDPLSILQKSRVKSFRQRSASFVVDSSHAARGMRSGASVTEITIGDVRVFPGALDL